ncbi:MAG TPA: hypothetical protein VFC23_20965 [Thermoanaerobaculia bacterium]|nr:hypothetical protein [Thermoanaerobaculia bacterium]
MQKSARPSATAAAGRRAARRHAIQEIGFLSQKFTENVSATPDLLKSPLRNPEHWIFEQIWPAPSRALDAPSKSGPI